jgi:putative addiction module antidote
VSLALGVMPSYYNIRYNGGWFVLALKISQIGNSIGLVLPKEAVSRLKVGKGDVVYLTEAADGYRITPYDPVFEQQVETARAIMKRRRNALRELAK